MKYLLAISIGPVQEFIAAARRTADLLAGSELLVKIAQTVAESVARHGTLIFPADTEHDGPNKILALITDGEPAGIAKAARKAADERLQYHWDRVKMRIPNLDAALAKAQIVQFLEFYAAWYPVAEDQYGYQTARLQVDRLLAGRKARREFTQPISPGNRLKSPLDPSRDCALAEIHPKCHRYPLYLKQTETLDAVSLLKRIYGVEAGSSVEGSMPSTSEMALRAVLPQLERAAPQQMQRLTQYRHALGSAVDLGDFFFLGRLKDMAGEELTDKLTPDQLGEIDELRCQVLEKIGRKECPPYYAILVADGDRMGAMLNEMTTIEQHQQFSRDLSGFAEWAKGCVRQHHGQPVYTGGDDVLALLPVNRALECAAALAREFRARLIHPKDGGTLSVGIAIVHFLDSLQVSLGHARAAERLAKVERNSLAVAQHTRGGEPLSVSDRWDDIPNVDLWQGLVRALQSDLSRGFPYELRTLAREWHGADIPEEMRATRLRAEAERVLARKKGGNDEAIPAIATLRARFQKVNSSKDLENLAKRMVIARFLAAYEPLNEVDSQEKGQ
jgi:CRISPR-associated protein Cmr2